MSELTVGDLKALLEDYDDDTTVRIMSQANYPFENSLAGIWETTVPEKDDEDGEGFVARGGPGSEGPAEPGTSFLYLVEGSQLAYGCRMAWDECHRH